MIDRGTQNVATVELVRAIVDAGAARMVLGNHEFNAICFATTELGGPLRHLRERTAKNRGQHKAFLDEVAEDSSRHAELIEWFTTIPLWLELDGLRVVHACWNSEAISRLRALVDDRGAVTDELVVAASRRGSSAYGAVETILKGPEIALPEAYWFRDKDGHLRDRARFRWWDRDATTLRQAAAIPLGVLDLAGGTLGDLPGTALDDAPDVYADEVPVIVGHYWQRGLPQLLAEHVACVDYSVDKGGALVAYRWDGEMALDPAKFFSHPPR